MRISVISFTEQGRQLAKAIRESLPDSEVELYHKPEQGVVLWSGEQFEKKRALIFVGACGIAVRGIAPFVRDKLSDSPVLVMDEKGQYVIPILSGHVGGANELARLLSDRLGAAAVITTATDINHTFAADIFAKENELRILNREGIMKVSAKALRGEKLTVSIEGYGVNYGGCEEQVPEEIELVSYPPLKIVDILVSSEDEFAERAILKLKPKIYVLGIGCKKEKTKEEIGIFIRKNLEKLGITAFDVAMIASIELKKDEPGICAWAEENRVPFVTFSQEKLRAVKGDFHGSDFVKQVTGVDNVCERAALAASGTGGLLVLEKQAENGITLAVAKRKWQIEWKKKAENKMGYEV